MAMALGRLEFSIPMTRGGSFSLGSFSTTAIGQCSRWRVVGDGDPGGVSAAGGRDSR